MQPEPKARGHPEDAACPGDNALPTIHALAAAQSQGADDN